MTIAIDAHEKKSGGEYSLLIGFEKGSYPDSLTVANWLLHSTEGRMVADLTSAKYVSNQQMMIQAKIQPIRRSGDAIENMVKVAPDTYVEAIHAANYQDDQIWTVERKGDAVSLVRSCDDGVSELLRKATRVGTFNTQMRSAGILMETNPYGIPAVSIGDVVVLREKGQRAHVLNIKGNQVSVRPIESTKERLVPAAAIASIETKSAAISDSQRKALIAYWQKVFNFPGGAEYIQKWMG